MNKLGRNTSYSEFFWVVVEVRMMNLEVCTSNGTDLCKIETRELFRSYSEILKLGNSFPDSGKFQKLVNFSEQI